MSINWIHFITWLFKRNLFLTVNAAKRTPSILQNIKKKGTVSTIAASDWLRFHTENRFKKKKNIKLWIKRLADFNAIYSFHESIAVDSTFYHFYRKFYCPKVTYWEQGQKVGFKRCRPKKKKSSMRDFYCNYAHFWFLFLGGLDCCFVFFLMSWIKPGSFEFVLKPRECTAIFPELDLREVTWFDSLFVFFVAHFIFLTTQMLVILPKKVAPFDEPTWEHLAATPLLSSPSCSVFKKGKKKKMYIFRSVIGVIFLVTYTRDSSSFLLFIPL